MHADFDLDSRKACVLARPLACGAARFVALGLLFFLVACTYAPGDVANPLTRKFTWLSFLGGDDIRAACAAGAPDRFRLIYNGTWRTQVRIYELGFAGPRTLEERVIGPGELFEISFENPLAPWRGATSTITLPPDRYDQLVRRLGQSGAFRTPSSTLTLHSTAYYWVAATCHGGMFHLTGWLYPSVAFSQMTFPQELQAVDRSKVPFSIPGPAVTPPLGTADNPARGSHSATNWSIGIAQDRLVDQVIF